MSLEKVIEILHAEASDLALAISGLSRNDKLYLFNAENKPVTIYVHRNGWVLQFYPPSSSLLIEIKYDVFDNKLKFSGMNESAEVKLGNEFPVIHIGKSLRDDFYLTLTNSPPKPVTPVTNYEEFLNKFVISMMLGGKSVALGDLEISVSTDILTVYKPDFDLEIKVGYGGKRPLSVYFTNTVKPQFFPIGTKPYEYQYYPIFDVIGNELVINFEKVVTGTKEYYIYRTKEFYGAAYEQFRGFGGPVNVTTSYDLLKILGTLLESKGLATYYPDTKTIGITKTADNVYEVRTLKDGWQLRISGTDALTLRNNMNNRTLEAIIGTDTITLGYSSSIDPVLGVDTYNENINISVIKNRPSRYTLTPDDRIPSLVQYLLFGGKGQIILNDVEIHDFRNIKIGDYRLIYGITRGEEPKIDLYGSHGRIMTFILVSSTYETGCISKNVCKVYYYPVFMFIDNVGVMKAREHS